MCLARTLRAHCDDQCIYCSTVPWSDVAQWYALMKWSPGRPEIFFGVRRQCAMEALLPLYARRGGGLKRHHAKISAEVRSVRQRVARASQSSSASVCGPRRQGLTMWTMLYMLAAHCVEVATAFALGQGRSMQFKRRGSKDKLEKYRQSCANMLHTAYTESFDGMLLAMFTDSQYYGTPGRVLLATRYVMEYDLFQWLVKQNCDSNVAPDSTLRYATSIRFIPLEAPQWARHHYLDMLHAAGQRAYDWVRSFRQRWGARGNRVIPINPELEQSEMMAKAGRAQ